MTTCIDTSVKLCSICGQPLEIKFKRDTQMRQALFVPAAMAHPAKMDGQLEQWIIENYTEPGETILDPMAGTGTAMIACTLGRNVIMVELEEKFVRMQQANWQKVSTMPQLGYLMGTCQILHGDARQLEGTLADRIITSPPYADMMGEKHNSPSNDRIVTAKRTYNTYTDRVDKIIASPPYAKAPSSGGIAQEGFTRDFVPGKISGGNKEPVGRRSYMPENTGVDPANIQLLSYGSIDKVDKIVTSPPYAEIISGSNGIDWAKSHRSVAEGGKLRDVTNLASFSHLAGKGLPLNYSDGKNNIGNLNYGDIDKIICSPPYEEHHQGGVTDPSKFMEGSSNGLICRRYTDAIITSPPYENQIHERNGLKTENFADPAKVGQHSQALLGGYSENSENIGNLHKESYLSAMLQVYRQCFTVLRPRGLMILVTKNFARDRKEVRLDLDTIKLCEMAGFTFVERHYRILTAQSFWKILQLIKCDYRMGSKSDPRCKKGLSCPELSIANTRLNFDDESAAGDQNAATTKRLFEKQCPEYRNSAPEINKEDVLIFWKN